MMSDNTKLYNTVQSNDHFELLPSLGITIDYTQ